MVENLRIAQELVRHVRFSGDTLGHNTKDYSWRTEAIKDQFYLNELKVSQEVTPSLYERLQTVCDHLHIPPNSVEAFIYPSSEIQATCFPGNATECVIRFSSALIDILAEDEFRFVAGHELGHFLLGHSRVNLLDEDKSLEYFMQQRAQEISVDRIGLLACKDLNVALKALMKIVSGLTDRHLRFDVRNFLSQLRQPSKFSLGDEAFSTHPSILVRCRGLLWFSMSEVFKSYPSTVSTGELSTIDERIEADLSRYVDGPARARIHGVKKDLSMWMAVYEIVQVKRFRKNEQLAFAKIFGTDTLDRLKNFLQDMSAEEAKDIVHKRLQATSDELKMLIPKSFEAEVETIKKMQKISP